MNKKNLEDLWNQSRVDMRSIKDIDLSGIPQSIIDQKNARQIIWHLIHQNFEIQLCDIESCNNPTRWVNDHYQKFCGRKCSAISDDTRAASKQTNLQKYGVDNPSKASQVKDQIDQTMKERYGVKRPMQDPSFVAKASKTYQKQHGYSHQFKNPDVQEKIRKIFIEKYGVTNVKRKRFSQKTIDILTSKNKFNNLAKDKSIYELSAYLERFDISTLQKYINKYETEIKKRESSLEHEMAKFLDEIGVEYIRNDRKTIYPLELDFILPEYNMAIEMNGIYWHCDRFIADKYYHYNKWNACDDLGIHLVSIFEDLWVNDQHKVKAALTSLMGMKRQTMGARNMQMLPITAKLARPFLENHHLQSFVSGDHYGAFDSLMRLRGVMSFGVSRNQHFELKRFVTDSEYSYPGLASKLFKYAQQDLAFDQVVSFSDNTWFTGKMYERLGFIHANTIGPAYRYFYQGKLVHCSTFTKQGIVKKFPHMKEKIDSGMTEREAMIELGIPRIYDCGKKKWIWQSSRCLY